MAEDTIVLCQFCGYGQEIEQVAGKLHAAKTDYGKIVSAHHRCMQYASALTQYKMEEFGGFEIDEVEKEVIRGKKLRCFICRGSRPKQRGASSGCAVRSCRKTFHFPCAFRDPDTITKRLVVTTNKNSESKEKFVYYRVFCTKEHEVAFRELLKEELKEEGKSKRKRSRPSKPAQEESTSQGEDEEDPGSGRSKALAESSQTDCKYDVSSSHNVNATCHSPVKDVKKLSPGKRLLLSVASNQGTEEAEAVTSGVIRSLEQAVVLKSTMSPLQVLAESETGATHATVVVHTTAHQRHTETELDHIANESKGFANKSEGIKPTSTFATPADRHSSSKINVSQVLNVNMESGHGLGVDLPVRRLSRKIAAEASSGMQSDSSRSDGAQLNGTTPQSSIQIASLNASMVTPTPRQLRQREFVPQNGFGDISVLIDSPTEMDISHDLPRSTRSTRSKTAEQRTEGASDASVRKSGSMEILAEGVSGQNDLHVISDTESDINRKSRKRKADKETRITTLSDHKTSRAAESTPVSRHVDNKVGRSTANKVGRGAANKVSSAATKTVSGDAVSTVAESLASVLLMPSSVGLYKQNEKMVIEMATEAMDVHARSVCVWQEIVTKTLTSDLIIYFMIDIINELRSRESEVLLKLLFDEDHLAARKSSYMVQAEVFRTLGDDKSQKAFQAALMEGLERKVRDLPNARLLHLPNQHFITLAIDVRQCPDSLKMQSYLQAYKGLSWWDLDIDVSQLGIQSSILRSQAAQIEAWIWQVWLTQVCPVSEVHILPFDCHLQDKVRIEDSIQWQRLVQALKDGVRSPRGGRGLLLVFQIMDERVVNFQQYFRKACLEVLTERPSGCVLALVPLDNLKDKSYTSVVGLMGGDETGDAQCTVSIRSAFSPHIQMTTMVLLEIVTSHSGPLTE